MALRLVRRIGDVQRPDLLPNGRGDDTANLGRRRDLLVVRQDAQREAGGEEAVEVFRAVGEATIGVQIFDQLPIQQVIADPACVLVEAVEGEPELSERAEILLGAAPQLADDLVPQGVDSPRQLPPVPFGHQYARVRLTFQMA